MRLTPSGWGALAAGAGLYATGVALGLPELTVAGAALLLLLVAAVGLGAAASEPGGIAPAGAGSGAARQPGARARQHRQHRPPAGAPADRGGPRRRPGRHPRRAAAASRGWTSRRPTACRPTAAGVFDVGPLVLAQTDPFGLLARRRPFGEAARLWVHPQSHPVPAARSGSTIEMDGPMDDTAPEGTIAFQGLRPYVVGDDLRMVHWRTTARTGTLMVKKHVDTNRPQVVVLLDDRRASYPG